MPDRIAEEARSGEALWSNHCEHCGTRMEEEELHDESDGPFGRMPHEGLEGVRLHPMYEPFEASVGGESHDLTPLDS